MKKDYVSQVFCIKIDGEGVPLKLNENWATTIFNAFTDLYDPSDSFKFLDTAPLKD